MNPAGAMLVSLRGSSGDSHARTKPVHFPKKKMQAQKKKQKSSRLLIHHRNRLAAPSTQTEKRRLVDENLSD